MSDSFPQQHEHAERSVLGCALFDELGADIAIAKLDAECFYNETHRVLFELISEQRKAGVRPDVVTLLDRFASETDQTQLDAAQQIESIASTVPHSGNVSYYAGIVRDKFQARQAIRVLRNSLMRLDDPAADTIEILSDIVDEVQKAISEGIADAPQSAAAGMADALASADIAKIPTGFSALDSKTGGLSPKTVTIIGARPGAGKTSLVAEICRRLTMFGLYVLMFSVEMSRRSIIMRLAAMELGLPFSVIRDGRLGDENRAAFQSMERAEWLSRFLIDEQSRTVDEMTAITRLYARRFNVKVVVIDYLQLVPPANNRQPREVQVAEISRGLKQLAKCANVAVICLAQLNRDVEKRDHKRPRISDLRESGAIEQDADLVWLLWRPNKDSDEKDDHAELIVAKSRNGETGVVRLGWHGPTMTFDDFREPECQVPDTF